MNLLKFNTGFPEILLTNKLNKSPLTLGGNPLKFNTEFSENQVKWWISPCNSTPSGGNAKTYKKIKDIFTFFSRFTRGIAKTFALKGVWTVVSLHTIQKVYWKTDGCRCLRSIVVVRSLRKRKVASSILAEGLQKFYFLSYSSS